LHRNPLKYINITANYWTLSIPLCPVHLCLNGYIVTQTKHTWIITISHVQRSHVYLYASMAVTWRRMVDNVTAHWLDLTGSAT